MKTHLRGFWGTSHWILGWMGRGFLWLFPARTSPRDDEAYTMAGGAVLGLIFGATFGYLSFAQPSASMPITGTVLGSLLGVCTGIILGAIVHVIDEWVDAWLHSIDSR
jgi:hypothetical protein